MNNTHGTTSMNNGSQQGSRSTFGVMTLGKKHKLYCEYIELHDKAS